MSSLRLSIEPGFYLEPQVAQWIVDPDVEYIAFNQGGSPPAISEYIAYDTLVPPNPFLAVTQDGRGRVVYDGGFPKFYNNVAPAAGSTFAQLSGSFKFLYNALDWVSNQEKVSLGNNKILILGDANSGESYSVKDTAASSFKTSLDRICAIAGFVPTYKTRSDYDGLLDARLTELDQYAAVLLMSSRSVMSPLITSQCVNDLLTFRNRGNGLIIITDHGPVINSIEDAGGNLPSNGLFATANKLIVNFGAFFSGDYNRTPVNVGFLRSTYGDHPLYNGMDNSENISAGGSESRVVVSEITKIFPENLPEVSISTPGQNRVQAIAMRTDGQIDTYMGLFVIAQGDILTILDSNGQPLTQIDIGFSNTLTDLSIDIQVSGIGTIVGEIRNNTKIIGSFTHTDDFGTSVNWFAGSADKNVVNNGDVVSVNIVAPFSYTASATVDRFQPDVDNSMALGDICAKCLSEPNDHPATVLSATMNRVRQATGNPSYRNTLALGSNVRRLKDYFSRTLDGSKLPEISLAIYPTEQAAESALESYTPPTFAEIFTNWGRTQGATFYPPGSEFPSEAAAWVWDDENKLIRQPLNTSSWVSFVSPEQKDSYSIDVVLSSTSNDDDSIGLLLAAPIADYSQQGTSPQLMARIQRSPLLAAGASLAIMRLNVGGNLIFNSHIPTQATDNGSDGWAGKTRRIRAIRRGDQFRVESSDWNSNVLLPEATIEFTLDDFPELSVFKGPQNFGLTCYSQPQTTYSSLKIEDGTVESVALVLATNAMYQYSLNDWSKVIGVNLADVYGVGRIVVNSLNNQRYRISPTGQLQAIT